MSSNSNKKRDDGAHGERSHSETKLLRRTDDDADPKQQQQMDELQHLEEKLITGIQSKEQELSKIQKTMQREISQMQAQLKKIRSRIISVKEEPAKEERARRRAANPRIEQALHMYQTEAIELDELLVNRFPGLIDDCLFWWAFLDMHDQPLDPKVREILYDREPRSVLNNKDLMLQLCKYNPLIYGTLPHDSQLVNDAQIVETVLESHPFAVVYLPNEVQLQIPHTIGQAFARLPLWMNDLSKDIKEEMDAGLWENRDAVLGWLKGGGELHSQIPQALREDKEILLTAMGNTKPTSLQKPTIPNSLKGFHFMKQAVEKNPLMLDEAAENLSGNKDLSIAALSGPHGLIAPGVVLRHFMGDQTKILAHWTHVGESIRQRLRLHHVFVQLVLGSVQFSDTKPSNLSILNQGEATSKAYMKLIAEFAGVPVGEELGKLRCSGKKLAWLDLCSE